VKVGRSIPFRLRYFSSPACSIYPSPLQDIRNTIPLAHSFMLMQALRTIYIVFGIAFLATSIAGFNMASVEFPVRQCLTCAANGATCDGGFPVCRTGAMLEL
jgi:hypothetical protein